MRWKETCPMEERMVFVIEHGEGALSMAELCRCYGVSRKTGYKWIGRFATAGVDGLKDRSRAPHHHPHAVSAVVEEAVMAARPPDVGSAQAEGVACVPSPGRGLAGGEHDR